MKSLTHPQSRMFLRIYIFNFKNKQTSKKTQESKKAKETKEEKRISPENKFAATRVKIFLVTRISGNKSCFLASGNIKMSNVNQLSKILANYLIQLHLSRCFTEICKFSPLILSCEISNFLNSISKEHPRRAASVLPLLSSVNL